MTDRAIRGNNPFEIDCIGPTEERDATKVEYFSVCPTPGIAIIYLLYDFGITIGTGNNEQAIQGNIAL